MFTICLITKNESAVLKRCIDSLSEFQKRGGEICVLDTGSTDNTTEIAESSGCKVFKKEFRHTISKDLAHKINKKFVIGEKEIVKEGDSYFDFASARNHGASLASNDWVCWMDADEIFTRFDIDRIEKIIEDETLAHLAYEFIFAHQTNGSPALQFKQSKFYNRKQMKWVNITHE